MELVQTDPAQPGRRYDPTDAQFSVRAVLDGTGKLTDRIRSSAYGVARHGWRGDTDGDGAATLADRSILLGKRGLAIGDAGYSPDCDLDRSGAIDLTDTSLWAADGFKAALPAGWISDTNVLSSPSGPASPVGYCGYLFNAATQLYTVRFRHYDPGLGRWLQRDPAGYVDGMNLLEYLAGTPLMLMDPFGLESDGGKFDPIPRPIWYEYDEGPWVRQVERETGRVYERRAVYRRHMTSWGEFELVGIERRLRPDLDRSDVDMPECLCSEGQDALVHAYGGVVDAAQGEFASEVRSIVASGGLMLLVRTKGTDKFVAKFLGAFDDILDSKTGATKAGRHLRSHSDGASHRPPSAYFRRSGTTEASDAADARRYLDEILSDPDLCIEIINTRDIRIRNKNRHGVKFDAETGEFIGWLEP